MRMKDSARMSHGWLGRCTQVENHDSLPFKVSWDFSVDWTLPGLFTLAVAMTSQLWNTHRQKTQMHKDISIESIHIWLGHPPSSSGSTPTVSVPNWNFLPVWKYPCQRLMSYLHEHVTLYSVQTRLKKAAVLQMPMLCLVVGREHSTSMRKHLNERLRWCRWLEFWCQMSLEIHAICGIYKGHTVYRATFPGGSLHLVTHTNQTRTPRKGNINLGSYHRTT